MISSGAEGLAASAFYQACLAVCRQSLCQMTPAQTIEPIRGLGTRTTSECRTAPHGIWADFFFANVPLSPEMQGRLGVDINIQKFRTFPDRVIVDSSFKFQGLHYFLLFAENLDVSQKNDRPCPKLLRVKRNGRL